MLKIAITGGAGSGKSTVARMFQELGAEVLDADAVAREVVAVGTPVWQELRRGYGPEFFRKDGALHRGKLARRVFADPTARRRLNELIHPEIAREMQARLEDQERRGMALVLVEVPLLFETGLEKHYDRVIVVYTGEGEQVQRIKERDRRGEEEIGGILQAQWPLEEKVAKADYVVDNSGTLDYTKNQVQRIWHDLQKIILTASAKKVSVPSNLP